MTSIRLRSSRASEAAFGLIDPSTYTLSLRLVTDLIVGTVTFTVMVTLLAASAAFMVTLLGIPMLLGTLLVARGFGYVERRRAGTLVSTTSGAPRVGRRLRDRLSDPGDWGAVVYSLLLFPVGLVTGTVTVAGWATAAAALTAPLYVGRFDDSDRVLAGINLEGPVAMVASVVGGVTLLLLMPRLVRTMARVRATLIDRLLP